MTETGDGPTFRLEGLIGESARGVRDRLGKETASRSAGRDRWLVYERPDLHLRVRLAPGAAGAGDAHAVASWTVTFRDPPASVAELARRLGLAAPRLAPALPGAPLYRAPLRDPVSGALHSLTALRRRGGFVQATVFDEAPDWLAPGREAG